MYTCGKSLLLSLNRNWSYRQCPVEQSELVDGGEALGQPRDLVARLAVAHLQAVEQRSAGVA